MFLLLETTNKDIDVFGFISSFKTVYSSAAFFYHINRFTEQQGILHMHLFVHYIKRLVKSAFIFNDDLTSVASCSKSHITVIKLL